MAVGCVGRYPDLPIQYLVDGEGPPIKFVAAQAPVARATSPATL